jgi:membrane protease YdiL (CAAX protease family)
MVQERSASDGLHPVLAPVVVFLGVVAMTSVALAVGRSLGIKGALALGETALMLPGVLALLILGIPLGRGLALRSAGRETHLLGMAYGIVLWPASLGLLYLQQAVWPPPPGFLESFKALHKALAPHDAFDAVLSVCAIAVAPAVCEELLFRGVVLGSLRRLGPAVAVLGSAVLFGLIHVDTSGTGPTLYRVPFAFGVGLALGLLRLRSDSLVPGAIAHATLNTVTFLVAPLVEDEPDNASPEALLGLALLAGGLLLAALVLRRVRPAGCGESG